MFFRDPRSIIPDDDEDIFPGSPREKMNFPFFRDRLNTVDEEVRYGQIELADVDSEQGYFFLKMGFDPRVLDLGIGS